MNDSPASRGDFSRPAHMSRYAYLLADLQIVWIDARVGGEYVF